jgi:hypothetical protein
MDSSVSNVRAYMVGIQDSIPVQDKYLPLFHRGRIRSGTHPAPNQVGNRGVVLLGQSGWKVKMAILLHILRYLELMK